MISCAELGLSTNSPICLKRNGVVLDKSDIQTIRAIGTLFCHVLFIGISPYDTIDVTILTRGSSMNHLPPDSREQTCESSKQVKRSMENTVQDSKRRKRCLVDIVKGIEQYFRDSTSIHY